MARAATVRQRVERILSAHGLPKATSWRTQALVAAGLAPLVAICAVTIAKGTIAQNAPPPATRADGTVITDALGPYEVFARSPEFFVYTVSAGPAAMLSGGLAVAPDYSLGDVDAGTAPGPDVVVIPAVVSPAGSKERPLREWLARRAGRGAQLLGVCAGSRLLAAAGLLDGRRATSHWSRIRGLERSRPQVDWVRGQRYIQDGTITTTAGVTSGVFGALQLVQQLVGAAGPGESVGQLRNRLVDDVCHVRREPGLRRHLDRAQLQLREGREGRLVAKDVANTIFLIQQSG
jgi:transcriptional regulator GlxA family with amidase domain